MRSSLIAIVTLVVSFAVANVDAGRSLQEDALFRHRDDHYVREVGSDDGEGDNTFQRQRDDDAMERHHGRDQAPRPERNVEPTTPRAPPRGDFSPPPTTSESPTPAPSTSLVPTVSPSPSLSPSNSKVPSAAPTGEPSPGPTVSPQPSNRPSQSPAPTMTPMPSLSSRPSAFPTVTSAPTEEEKIAYFKEPKLMWSTSLSPGVARIEAGNAVTVSPDQERVYITRSDGRLDVIHGSDGVLLWSYEPSLGENMTLGVTSCEGGVAFGKEDETGVDFLVYPIIETEDGNSQSRMVAFQVNEPVDDLLWISDPLPGQAQGTPVVTQHVEDVRGKFVYVTHNVEEEGFFSMLSTALSGGLLISVGSGSGDPSAAIPYGPIGVAHKPVRGNYVGGEDNDSDMAVWASSADDGTGRSGNLTAFQFSVPSDIVFLRDVRWNAIAKPTLSHDGLKLFVASRASQVKAWVSGQTFSAPNSWTAQLKRDDDQPSKAIANAPVLSIDEKRLFVSSTTTTFAGIDTSDGRILWEVDSRNSYTSEAWVSPDDVFVYAIQSDGTVQAFYQENGTVAWAVNCNSLGADCNENEVAGEFSLSRDGLRLFFGTTSGDVLGLTLAEFAKEEPSSAPSVVPTMTPSYAPSANPSVSPTPPPVQPTPSPVQPTTTPPTSLGYRCYGGVWFLYLSLWQALALL